MAHQQRSRLSDGLTKRNRFVEILKAQEAAAPPIESHAQGLAHLLRQGLAGYNRSKDDRDRTAVADVFRAGSAGEGGYQGGLDAIAAGDFSGNEYAGQYQDHYAPMLEQRRYTEAQADKAFSRQRSLRTPRQRRILTGPDGYQYYENGERVLPNAQNPNDAFLKSLNLDGTPTTEAATGQDHPFGTPVGVSDQSPGLRFPTAAAQQGPVAASLMPEGSAPQAQLGPLATRLGDMPPVHPPSTPLSFGNLEQTPTEPVNSVRAAFDALPPDVQIAMQLPGADALAIFQNYLTQKPSDVKTVKLVDGLYILNPDGTLGDKLGDLPPGAATPSTLIKNYNYAVENDGFTGTFQDFATIIKMAEAGQIYTPAQNTDETPEGNGPDTGVITPIPGSPAGLAAEEAREKLARLNRNTARASSIVTQEVERSLRLIEGGAGGLSAVIGQKMPGAISDSGQLVNLIQTVKALAGFETLQQMRQASPTGGSLGQVSNLEIGFLQDAMGNLEITNDEQELAFNMKRIANMFYRITNGTPQELAEAVRAGKITQVDADAIVDPYDLSNHFTDQNTAPPIQIQNDAEFEALPSGTEFIGPDGITRRKP